MLLLPVRCDVVEGELCQATVSEGSTSSPLVLDNGTKGL